MNFLTDGPPKAPITLALAHGAGAGMDHPFMESFAHEVAKKGGIRVVRFEFTYMARRRTGGKGGPPDREPVLRATWLEVIAELESTRLFIGGKSMGGRIASLVADGAEVAGLVCLGYPFHPTGKPDTLRVEHLKSLKTPALFVQGERDPFGSKSEVAGYTLSSAIQVHWLKDGDHSFAPRKSSGTTAEQNLTEAAEVVARFLAS